MTQRPTTSIVILTRNQLEYTKLCVEGIARTTPEPHELVFVDNASTDGTLEYLRSIEGAVVIDNDANLGFGGACNQGMAVASGDRILLLNNDVVPTAGWLAALHDALDSSEQVAMAGPRSNRIAGVQQVDGVAYDEETLDGLDAWAARWCAAHRGERTPTLRLVGFCILMERSVLERIGGFDLRFEVGNFEDDDLCLRAAVAGFGAVVAEDSFIHHFGSRTFAGERIDYAARMQANFARFAQSWGMAGDELDVSSGSYPAGQLVARTAYDASRHFAPLVGVDRSSDRIDVPQVRSRVSVVCCDRIDPDGTRAALDAAFAAYGPDDDVTVLVRLDPRDSTSPALLEAAADDRERVAGLPDVVVVQARDEDDRPVLHAADEVIVAGRAARARSLLARRMELEVRQAGS